MALQLYAIVRREHPVPPPSTPGMALPPLRAVEWDKVAAVVRDVDDGQQLTDEDAVGHLTVLNQLVMSGPVLPLRFGMAAPNDDSVREEVLRSAEPELLRRLDEFDGFVEVRLDLRFDEDAAVREVVAANPELRALATRAREPGAEMDERIRLGELVTEHVGQWRQARADALLPGPTELAERSTPLKPPEPRVERRAFLVAMDRLPDMDAAVQEVREAHPEVDFEYIGPLPAYSFLELTLASAQPESESQWGW